MKSKALTAALLRVYLDKHAVAPDFRDAVFQGPGFRAWLWARGGWHLSPLVSTAGLVGLGRCWVGDY